MICKFRKRPIVIEAVQLRWDTWSEMCDFAGVGRLSDGQPEGTYLKDDGEPTEHPTERLGLCIPTLEGLMIAQEGDWVIRGIAGELYPCKPDIFETVYEQVLTSP